MIPVILIFGIFAIISYSSSKRSSNIMEDIVKNTVGEISKGIGGKK